MGVQPENFVQDRLTDLLDASFNLHRTEIFLTGLKSRVTELTKLITGLNSNIMETQGEMKLEHKRHKEALQKGERSSLIPLIELRDKVEFLKSGKGGYQKDYQKQTDFLKRTQALYPQTIKNCANACQIVCDMGIPMEIVILIGEKAFEAAKAWHLKQRENNGIHAD